MSSLLTWQEIAADNVSGASEIYARVLQIFVRRLSVLDQTQTALEEWPQWLRAVLQAQPAMAPLYNLANALALVFEQKHLTAVERIAQARAFLQNEALQSSQSNDAIARHALALIAEKPRVLTHSFSGTVAAALEYAFANGVKVEAYLSEGRPANEGQRMAERLARAGMAVHFFVDDARARFMNAVDLVVLGADRIAEEIFVNKIGTCITAQLASAHKIPVAVLAARNKLWPLRLPFGQEAAHPREEIWSASPSAIAIHNFYFEETALRLALFVITEHGAFAAAQISGLFRNFRAAEFWKQL